MPGSRKFVSLVLLCALLVLAIAPAAFAQSFTPLIFAVDQDVVDSTVNVTRVTSDGPGWVVIESDVDGQPTEVLGYVAVPNGISANIAVPAEVPAGTKLVWVMLHKDLGVEGSFEWPGDDVPADVNGAMVMTSINIGEVGTSLAGVARANGLGTLLQAAEAAGIAEDLASGGPYTVFAPTDEAFAKLPAGTLDTLLATPDTLAEILLYHVVPGVIESSAMTESMLVPTVQGEDLDVQVGTDGITVNGASVTAADVKAFNGVIHVIDTVLLPPSIVEAQAAAEAEAAATAVPTKAPTATATAVPTIAPTATATAVPTKAPTATATAVPTKAPTATATAVPTIAPTATATDVPTIAPTAAPVTETAVVTEAAPVVEAAVVTATEVVTEAAPVVEAVVVTATEVVTEAAPVVEAAVVTATEVMTEAAPAEAAVAPETLPTTGGAAAPSLGLLAGALVLLAIAAMAFVTRRRTA